ncbi:MAG: hypothetical protein EOO84_08520 [Pantoea sp.]|uniref:hypothetical protein n=1 Tax=Pantoea sp. TaxID=69393 RepID=UPI0011F65804|nr:hypothetical protein [Pantoea sp.]RZK07925.1 MAG: hypothetical protein EOO84_08520 [Pantoea sp.]
MTTWKKLETKLKHKEADLMASTITPQSLPLSNTSILLGIKSYNETVKGVSIWISEIVINKILWQKELTERDIITA